MQCLNSCVKSSARCMAVSTRPAWHGKANLPSLRNFAAVSIRNRNMTNFIVKSVEAPEASTTNQPEPSFVGAADTYAIVEIGGHQLVVEEGRWYTVNRLEAPIGSKIQLGRVLALKQDGEFHIGQPYLEGAAVEAEILDEMKGPKVIVYKMKPKKHYRRTNGHRQPLTKFLVTKISK